MRLAIISSALIVNSAYAATLYVEKWGEENAVCSRTEPCNLINAALNRATPNSRIIVGPGNYQENLVINTIGIKLESTGGSKVTTIDGRGSIAATGPTIDVQSDRVSIGKIRGKGFTILSKNAEVIRAGNGAEIVNCNIIPPAASFIVYTAEEIFSPASLVAGLRIEGNNLYQIVDQLPASKAIGCELDNALNPTVASLVTAPSLSAVNVIGDSVILTENNILGFGVDVIDLSKTTRRSTIKNNNIKHDFRSISGMAGFPFKASNFRDAGFAGIILSGSGSLVSDNNIEKVGNSGDALSSGIVSLSEKARITNNIVDSFYASISLLTPQTVSRNVIVNPTLLGVTDIGGGASILDNTISATKINSQAAGVVSSNSRFIRGNNINGFDAGVGLFITQQDTNDFRNRKFTTISNNNFYDLGENSIAGMNGRCGVFFLEAESFGTPIAIMPVRMSRNFFGSTTELPQIKRSSNDSIGGVAQTSGDSWHICADRGLVTTIFASGISTIAGVTTKPTLRPNRIRALLRINPL